jgi:uncharacterized membrane protein
MTELPDLSGPSRSPEPPADASANEAVNLRGDRYGHELDAWLERWKQQVAAGAVATALAATRQDTQLALDNQRQDTLTAQGAARADADRAAEATLLKSVHDAYVAVTETSLDRALTRVNVLTAAVASVITVYTGLLALVFAAKPGEGKPLTAAAVIPGIFLGTALLLATIYAAVFRNKTEDELLLPTGLGGQIAEMRLVTFMRWCFAGILARSWALKAGIVSLAIGVATLPIPFVAMPGWLQVLILSGGTIAVITTGAVAAARR